MDDTVKKAVAFTVAGSIFSATLPSGECGPKDMCAVEPPEFPHTHQDEPGQQGGDIGLRAVALASASSTIGTLIFLSSLVRGSINWKKII